MNIISGESGRSKEATLRVKDLSFSVVSCSNFFFVCFLRDMGVEGLDMDFLCALQIFSTTLHVLKHKS